MQPYLGTVVDMRKISNSEVATWETCPRRYYYAFDLALQPRQQPGALSLGILVHKALEAYYKFLQVNPTDAAGAKDAALKVLNEAAQQAEGYSFDTLMQARIMVGNYADQYGADPDWEILSVEGSYDVPLTDDYVYSLRLDLLVRERSTGKICLVDHKTAYDFWKPDDLALSGQFPKYLAALRANGIDVEKVIVNQLRKRVLKNPGPADLFSRISYTPSIAKMRNAMHEQILTSEKITSHRALPVEVRERTVTRNLNKMVCNYCAFKGLCMSEYDGGDITIAVQTEFTNSSYAESYNPILQGDM